MKHTGGDPFERPMRPDRVEAIHRAVEAFVICPSGVEVAKRSESFENYQECVGHVLYQSLAEVMPDTMIAELQEGLEAAKHLCSAIFKSRDDLSPEDEPDTIPDNTGNLQAPADDTPTDKTDD